MFERFLASFEVDRSSAIAAWEDPSNGRVPNLEELTSNWGGASFGSGIYRIHTKKTFDAAVGAIGEYLPRGRSGAIPFAFDWLGRNYVVDLLAFSQGSHMVLIVDLGEGRVFEVPGDLSSFHDIELVDYSDEALAASWFADWRGLHGDGALRFDQCVGYRTPIFLGGADDDDNLEVSDIDVYWSITSQLYAKVKSLPDGTRIGQISIED